MVLPILVNHLIDFSNNYQLLCYLHSALVRKLLCHCGGELNARITATNNNHIYWCWSRLQLSELVHDLQQKVRVTGTVAIAVSEAA